MTMRDPIDDLYDQLSPTLDAGQVDDLYARELAKAEEAAPDRGFGAEMWAQLRRGLIRVGQGIPQTAIGLPTAAARVGAGAIGLAGEAGGKALGYADRSMRAQAGEQARERVYRERFGDQAVDDALAVRGRAEPLNPEAFTRQPDIMRQVLGEPAEMAPYEATIRRGATAARVAQAGPSALGEAAGTLVGLPSAADQIPAAVARMVAEAGPDAALDWLESITPATGLQMQAAQADPTGSTGNFLLASAGSIAENAPQLAVQYATAMLTGGASLAGKAGAFAASAFPMEFADSFDSISKGMMQQNPGMTLEQARAKAALWASSVAAVNTMLERVEGGQLFAANPALHDALVRRTMDRAAKNFVVEGVTETMQEGVGAGAEYLSGADPTALDGNRLGPRLAIAGVTGGVLGGMGGAVAGAFDHSGEQAGATADPVVEAGKQAAADVKQGMTDEQGPAGTGAGAGVPGVATDAARSAGRPTEPGAVGADAAGAGEGAARRGRHKAGAAEPDGSGGGGGVDAYASMTREELEHTLRNRGDFHVDDKAMATLADDDLRQALREADAMAGVPSPQGTTTSKGKPHGEGQGRQKEQGRPQDEALLNPTGPSAGAATTTAPAPGSVPVGKAPNADRLVTPGGGAEVKPAGDGLENLRLGALVALAEAHGVDPSLDRAGIIDGLRRLGVKSVQGVEDAGDAAPSGVRPKGPDSKPPQNPGAAQGQPVARPEAQPIKPGVAGDGTAQGDSPRAGNRTPVHEAIRKQFADAGPGHAKVSRQIDDMVADGTLDEDNAAIVRSAMADMDDDTLAARINLRSGPVEDKHTGKAIDTKTGNAPTRRTKGAAALVLRGLANQLAARAAAGKSAAIDWTPSAVTLEEVGHIMVRIVPTEAQTDQMRAEYDSRSPEQWAAEFERDGFDREGAAYAASSYDEWAAHKFYLHALGRVSSNPAVRGVMQRVFNAFKRALQRFAEAAGFVPDHLLPIFEAMRLGKVQTESGRERAAPAPTRGKAQQTTQTLRPEATDDDMPTMGTDGSTRPASAPRGGGEPEPIQAQPPRVEPRPELPQERPAPSTAGQTERPKPPPMRNVVKGRESVVRLADGGELSITYAMVEADELTPSHDARANFAKNEAATINERNYHLPDQSQMSRAQVSRIANSPKPDLLYTDTPSATDGPPIVDSLGRVLGGNARTMGVQLAYFMPGSAGETYRKGAAQAASKFGIDPAAAESFQEPVIVRMLSEQDTESLLRTDDDEVRMSAALNEALTAGKTAETEAVSKAARLSPASINAIIAELDGYETLSEALENAGVQARIIRAMAQSGAWGARDTEAFVSDGKLNSQGRLALESALLGTVIRDVKAMSAIPPSLRNMMVKSVPSMLGIREAFDRPDSDVQFDGLFADAIKALDLARASGSTPMEAATSSLNPAGLDPVLRNPRTVALAEAMHEGVRSPRKFADRMARVVGAIREAANGQIDMMAGRALSPGEAFDLEMGVKALHGRGLFSHDDSDPTENVPLVEVRHVYGDNGEDRWQLFEKATGQRLGLRFVTLDAARRAAKDTNALRREEAIKRAEGAKLRANDVPSVESYVDAPKQPWETDEDYRLRRKWRGAAEDTGTLWGRRLVQDDPGFRAWFGDSQIRHGSGGTPKVVYHGTPDAGGDDGQGIQAFDRSKIRSGNLWGQGFYTTDRHDIAGGSDNPAPMQGYAQAALARSTPDAKRQEAARLIRARLDGLPEPNRRTLADAVAMYESNPQTTFRDIEAAAYSAGVDVGDVAASAGLLQGSGVIPAYLRMERPLRVDSRDEVLAFLRRVMDEGDRLTPSLRSIRDAGGAMIREAMQPGSIARRMLEDNPARFLRRAFGGSNGELARQMAERLGYDGLIERKSATASVPGHDIYVVFQPDQIKSVFARSFTRGEPRMLHGRPIDQTPGAAPQEHERREPEQGSLFGRALPPDSREFREWFEGSEVVDGRGRPLVVYHGTPDGRWFDSSGGQFKTPAQRWNTEPGPREALWFTSSARTAKTYADDRRAFDYQGAEPAVIPVYLRIKNPLRIDGGGRSWSRTMDAVKRARDAGHDGIIITNVIDDYNTEPGSKPTTVYAVFDGTQVKHATRNAGTYGRDDPRSLFGRVLEKINQDELGFYSRLEGWVGEKMRGPMPAGQLRVALKNAGLPADEIKWTGIDDWLAEKKGEKVTPDQVREYLSQNKVELKEKVLGGGSDSADMAEAVRKRDAAKQKASRILNQFDGRAAADDELGWQIDKTARFLATNPDGLNERKHIAIEGAIEAMRRPYGEDVRADMDKRGLFAAMREAIEAATDAERLLASRPPSENTKYERFTLPGGENYREVLLTLPSRPDPRDAEREYGPDEEPDLDENDVETVLARDRRIGNFRSSHFSEPNIIAHLRLKDRTTPGGKRVLFAEEIQSDWHEAGRDRGYQRLDEPAPTWEALKDKGWRIEYDRGSGKQVAYTPDHRMIGGGSTVEGAQASAVAYADGLRKIGVPPAPWSKTWHEMAFRRLLRLAASGGYDAVGWTTGDTQIDRYEGLAQRVEKIEWEVLDDGVRKVFVVLPGNDGVDFEVNDGKVFNASGTNAGALGGQPLREVVGADLAKRILSEDHGSVRGPDIRIGGDGMRNFYDRDLVNYARKYGKKWGAEPRAGEVMTGPVDHPSGDPSRMKGQGSAPSHLLPITPAMRNSVLEDGQPLFGRFLWDRDDADPTPTAEPTPVSLFEVRGSRPPGASSPSERGAGDTFNAKGGATAPVPPATASPQTGRTGSRETTTAEAAFPDADTSLVGAWNSARLDTVASDTPGASANIIDAFGGGANAEAIIRTVLDRMNMAEMMAGKGGLEAVNTGSPMRLQNMKKLRAYLTGTVGRLHQQLHAIKNGYRRADVVGTIKTAGRLADLLMVRIGESPENTPSEPKMGGEDVIETLRALDTGYLRRWYKGERTFAISAPSGGSTRSAPSRAKPETPAEAAKRLQDRGEPMVLKDGRWQVEQHPTLTVPQVLPAGTRVRAGHMELESGQVRLSTPDFIVRKVIPHYGGDTAYPKGTHQVTLERQPLPGDNADRANHYFNVVVDKNGRLIDPLMPTPGSTGWSMGMSVIDPNAASSDAYAGETMFDAPRSVVQQAGDDAADADVQGKASDDELARQLADIAAERSAVDSFIRDRIGPDGGQVVLADGHMFVISRNTIDADKHPWRVTRFVKQPDGQVVAAGHDVARELDNPEERGAYPPGAVQVLAQYIRLSDTIDAPPPPQNKPTLATVPPKSSQQVPQTPQPTGDAEQPEEIRPYQTTAPKGFSWDRVPKRQGAITHPDRILFDPEAPEVPPGDHAYAMGQGDGLDGLTPEPPPDFASDYQRGYEDGQNERASATAPQTADDPKALDGSDNAERANDAVQRRINTLAGKAKVPPAAWKALEDLVHTDPVAAMAYARQKSLEDRPDAIRFGRIADRIAKMFGLQPRKAKMVPAGKGQSGEASVGQRRAKEGGEYGPNGEWYPGGSFINTVKENPKGDGSAPSGTDRPMVEDPGQKFPGAIAVPIDSRREAIDVIQEFFRIRHEQRGRPGKFRAVAERVVTAGDDSWTEYVRGGDKIILDWPRVHVSSDDVETWNRAAYAQGRHGLRISSGTDRPMRMDGTTRPENPAAAPRPPLPQKSVDLFNKAIADLDADRLAQMVDPANKNWREMFEARTGVKLPKTVGGSEAAAREWVRGQRAAAATAAPVRDEGKPWDGASVDDESKWFGTRVRVAPELRGESEIGGTIQRVLNGGRLVEVKPDGVDTTFRYDSDRVEVESDDHLGVASGMVQSMIRDGKEYRLYADDSGHGGSVRIRNLDTRESESRRFDSLAEAKAFFDKSIGGTSATANPASGAPIEDSSLSRRSDATAKPSEPTPPDHDAATRLLRQLGIEVSTKTIPGGRVIHSVTGNTYAHRDAIKSIPGNKPSWYGADKSWSFWNGDPTIPLAQALAGASRTGDQAKPATGRTDAEDLELLERRKRELDRPDERATGRDAAESVGGSTADLIRLGAKVGIPDEVLGWQVEDIGMIRKAFEAAKPMFLLGSAPGSGKTFVIAGAIREMKAAGAERFVWVTMNQTLIDQIKSDVAAYGINDSVQFATYADLSGTGKKGSPPIDASGAVLVLDEAHNVKNVGSNRGRTAIDLIGSARFTLFSSATPFEDPVQAKYLEPTGIFGSAGGHDQWAILFGAQARKIKVSVPWGTPGSRFGKIEKIVPVWVRTKEAAELAKGAKRWFEKQGILSQRPLRLPPNMVVASFERYTADPKYVDLYERTMKAYDAALGDWGVETEDGSYQSRDAQVSSLISMHSQNAAKRILEAAKVAGVIERAKKAAADGRKVVIFVETKSDRALGRFRKTNDTRGERYSYPEIRQMMQEWRRERDANRRMGEYGGPPAPFSDAIESIAMHMHEAGLVDAELPSVTDDILAAIPDAMVFTGEVPDAKARENLDRWRKSQTGTLVATMAKGGTGLSLHDKLGGFPTAMFVLNMPWTATQLEQVSGRINRYGLASIAHNYFLFADNIPFERKLAGRIGGRLRSMNATVKGLGSKAAASMEDFNFEDRTDVKHLLLADEQRSLDGAEPAAPDLDIFDQAAAMEKLRNQSPDKEMDYFATPYQVAAMMAHAADVRPGDRVLEPSAGEGNLLRFLPSGAVADIVEPHGQRRAMARGVGEQVGLEIADHSVPFEDFQGGPYSAVVMNPPFSRVAGKGWQDITHVKRAYSMLAPNGRLVAIMSEGPFFREDAQSTAFREWLDEVGATVIRLPEGAFKDSGTMVRARMIVVDRSGGNGGDLSLNSLDAGDVRAVAESIPTRPDRMGDEGKALYGRAFHGSPHTFDRFDISKIGTGEGAQSYGYGLYFASSKEVAEHYRNALSGSRKVDWLLDGKTPAHATNGVSYEEAARQNGITAEEQDALGFIGSERTIDATIKNLRAQAEMTWRGPKARELWSRRADIIERMRDRITLVNSPPGRLYEVDLKPAEDEYLLWDEPFSGQSEKVKKALRPEFDRLFAPGTPLPGWGDMNGPQDNLVKGERIYQRIASDRGGKRMMGAGDKQWGPVAYADERAASKHLHSLGIRGIKYLDGNSRNKDRFAVVMPDGTEHGRYINREVAQEIIDERNLHGARIEERGHYNYVIFDDADVEIEALHGRAITDPPPDDVNEYVKWSESQRALSSTYYEKGADGQWKARTGPDGAPVSSRTTPQAPQPYKVGQWRIDDGMHGIYGHEIAQLREVPLADLTLIEDDYTDPRNNGEGRGDDARRYAEWMREGRQAPPIEVIQHVDGHLVVSNGHRRTAAAKMAGKSTILAWVNPLMPTGEFYTNGKPILTGLTYEGAKYGAPRAYQDWNENVRVGQPATLLGRALPDDDIPPPPEDAHRVREAEKAVERKARILAEHGDGRVSQVRSTLAYAVGRADTFLRTLGPAGKQLASEALRIANRSAKRGNTDEADFKHAVKDLNRADREIVAKIGQFRKDPKSGYFYRDLRPDLAKIADGLRVIADRSMKLAASLGVERAGKQLRGGGGWYPQVPNAKGRAFMETAFHEGLNDPSVAKWADEQVADGKFRTPDAALGSLMKMRDDRLRGVNRYLESYRTLLPIDCVEWDLFKTVPPLLHKNALLVEAIREWGVKFEGARASIETIAEQAGGHWRRPLKAWLQASFDQYKHNPISRKVFGAWSNFETLGRLAFSPISSLQNYGQQFVNTAIFGYGPLGKALAQYPPLLNHWIESARAVAEKVDRSGATSDIGSIANPEQHGAGWSLAELGLKVGGFVAAERANQVRSAIIAYEGIKADFDRLLRAKSLDAAKGLRRIVEVLASPVRTPTDAVARRVQRFTGMSDAALKSRLLSGQRLTEAELEMVMVRMTRDTQFVQDLASEPAWFRMSPFLRLATKFKTWGTRQVGLVYEHVLKEARRGNFGPLVRLALAAVIAGELVNLLRDLLRGKDESLTAYMVGKRAFTWGDVAQRIVGDMRQGGAFGLLLDMTYGMSNFIGGPALNTFENAGRLAIRLVDKGGKLDADGVLASLDAAATEQLAVKRLADDLVKRYRVSRAGWPDNPMEWRTRTREWLREQKYASLSEKITGTVRDIVMGRFTIGDSTGSNVLPYRNAAHQIDVGDVDDAADYLYGVLRGVEPAKIKEAIGGIRQSMLAHSPLGAVAKKDLSAFLSQFPEDVRATALSLHGKWIAAYSKAMGEAIRRWSEEHRQPSGSP